MTAHNHFIYRYRYVPTCLAACTISALGPALVIIFPRISSGIRSTLSHVMSSSANNTSQQVYFLIGLSRCCKHNYINSYICKMTNMSPLGTIPTTKQQLNRCFVQGGVLIAFTSSNLVLAKALMH